jgi:hypothetical protein
VRTWADWPRAAADDRLCLGRGPRVELGAVVDLEDLDLERRTLDDEVDELDRGGLVERRVDAQHPQPGPVVDRGEVAVHVAPAMPPLSCGGGSGRPEGLWPIRDVLPCSPSGARNEHPSDA